MIGISYGNNAETLQAIRTTGFELNEVSVPVDLSRLRQYRAFIFRATEGKREMGVQ